MSETAERRPGPIRCHRCGIGWECRRAFLPMRHLESAHGWPWICVACFLAEAGELAAG
jgi:hypothetical protein